MERKFRAGDIVRSRFGDGKEYVVTNYQNIGAVSIFGGGNPESVVCIRGDEQGSIFQSYHDEGLLELVSRKNN
jgi:hypothetical protein